jgi:hypothetical protein
LSSYYGWCRRSGPTLNTQIEIKLHAFCENSLWANKPKTNYLWGCSFIFQF